MPVSLYRSSSSSRHCPTASASETYEARFPITSASFLPIRLLRILRNTTSSNAPHRETGAFMKITALGNFLPVSAHAAIVQPNTHDLRGPRDQVPRAFSARSGTSPISPEPLLQFPCAIGGKKSIVESHMRANVFPGTRISHYQAFPPDSPNRQSSSIRPTLSQCGLAAISTHHNTKPHTETRIGCADLKCKFGGEQ